MCKYSASDWLAGCYGEAEGCSAYNWWPQAANYRQRFNWRNKNHWWKDWGLFCLWLQSVVNFSLFIHIWGSLVGYDWSTVNSLCHLDVFFCTKPHAALGMFCPLVAVSLADIFTHKPCLAIVICYFLYCSFCYKYSVLMLVKQPVSFVPEILVWGTKPSLK